MSLVYRKLLTGIKDDNSLLRVRIYPNPANENITIEVPNNQENTEAVLFDLNGKQLASKEFNGKTIFDISEISAGIYFIEIRTMNAVSRTKIVRE
jgi:hypothetical protein